MKVVIFMLFGVVCTLCGCMAPLDKVPVQPGVVPEDSPESVVLWAPCDTAQADAWRLAAATDAVAALHGAACYAYLVERAGGGSTDAAAGRQLAEQAAGAFPRSAEAHYLFGYLAGLEAQFSPLRALSLVPVIEREALAALALNPALDEAGPARMLGDLYLRAPEFPVSVGDSSLAVEYFAQAVELAPQRADNRAGLIAALLEDEQVTGACLQLREYWQDRGPADDPSGEWQRGLELQQQLCDSLPGD